MKAPSPKSSGAGIPEMVAEALSLLHRSGAIAAAVEALTRAARALLAAPWCEVVPGVVERVVAPVRHVLSGL